MRLAIIQARDRSTRLPGKATLKFSDGKTVIEQVVNRVEQIEEISAIAIAIPYTEKGTLIDEVCKKIAAEKPITLHYGSEIDLFRRFYEVCKSYMAGGAPPTQILRITADDPFRDPELEGQVMNDLCVGYDYVYTHGYPHGTNAEGFSIDMLAYGYKHAVEREHISDFYLKEYPARWLKGQHEIKGIESYYNWGKYRVTLDTPDDWRVIQHIYDNRGECFSIRGIVEFLERRMGK